MYAYFNGVYFNMSFLFDRLSENNIYRSLKVVYDICGIYADVRNTNGSDNSKWRIKFETFLHNV